MYNSYSEVLPAAYAKKIRDFYDIEIKRYLAEHNCAEFNRESLTEFITVRYLNIFLNSSYTMELPQRRT